MRGAGPRGIRLTPRVLSPARIRRANGAAPIASNVDSAARWSAGSRLSDNANAYSYRNPAARHASAASRHRPSASRAYG